MIAIPRRTLAALLPILLSLTAVALGAEPERAAATDAPAVPVAAPVQAPKQAPASTQEPSAQQIAAWLAVGRGLKAERPDLFGGAAGVLATLVLPDGQGAAAGIKPGDVLVAYGETPLDSRDQLIALTGKTPPKQSLTLRWLRPGAGGAAEVLGAAIHGGRMGVGIRTLADTPAARMQALSDEGWAARNRGRYGESIGLFHQGLALTEGAGDNYWQGQFLSAIGFVLNDLGRYPEALEHYTQRLAVAREIDDRAGEGAVLGSLGGVFVRLGRYPESLEHFTQALAIAREIGDRANEAGRLNGLGTVFHSLGRYPEALEHHTQALVIAREIGNRSGQGVSLIGLGNIDESLGRYPEALEHFSLARDRFHEIGDRAREGLVLINLGVVYLNLGRYPEALEHFSLALTVQSELGEPETLWMLWNDVRVVWEGASHPASAILAGKHAVNTIQAMRAGNARLDQAEQQSFMQDKESVYRSLADLLIAQGRHAEAQQVLDMLKEQELYDYIKEEGAHDPRRTRVGYNAMETEWNGAYDARAAGARPLAQRLAGLTRIKPEVRTEPEQAEIARLTAERDALAAELQRQLAALPQRLAAVAPARQAAENARFAKAEHEQDKCRPQTRYLAD